MSDNAFNQGTTSSTDADGGWAAFAVLLIYLSIFAFVAPVFVHALYEIAKFSWNLIG